MGRISKISKAIISLNFVLAAAILVTSAVFTVNVLADGPGMLEVGYGGFPITEDGMAEHGGDIKVLAPGYYTDGVAFVANTGTEKAFVEITVPEIYLYRDTAGRVLPNPVRLPADDGRVTMKVDILAVDKDGNSVNLGYANNPDTYDDLVYQDQPGIIKHFALRGANGEILRHFFEIEAGDEYDAIDPETQEPETRRDPVVLLFRLTVDARTKADIMTNEWNGAQMRNVGAKAVRAALGGGVDIWNEFGLSQAEYERLDWARTRSFYLLAPAQ